MMTRLRFFSAEEVSKFKSDIVRLPVKRKTALRALDFATKFIFYTSSFPAYIHCSKFFTIGRVNQDPFPTWLKLQLFIEVDSTYCPASRGQGKNKGWIVNKEFFIELVSLIEGKPITGNVEEHSNNIGANALAISYKEELHCNKIIEYSESTGGRFYHTLQGVKRELKNSIIFKDFNDFDISSAAPSILFQLYHNICKDHSITYNRFTELSSIQYFINNKEEVRRDFAQKFNIEDNIAKKILNSFFNKSSLSANGFCIIFSKYLEYDYEKMALMQEDIFIKNLRRDIDFLWKKIESIFNPEFKHRTGKKTHRWFFYFREERKVLDIIIEELTMITGVKNQGYFLEHDSFRLHNKYSVDISKLEETIFERTGYRLTISDK